MSVCYDEKSLKEVVVSAEFSTDLSTTPETRASNNVLFL